MKIGIFGSCVTRDIVEYLPSQVELVLYFARSSLISVMAKAVPIALEQIHVDREFHRKAILRDMTKVFWEELEEARPDILILDFIDERFDLWRKADAIVTRSISLSASGVEQAFLSDFELMQRDAPATHELWKKSCTEFLERARKICGTIIIHRSLWAEKIFADGEIKFFDKDDQAKVRAVNRWLNVYYDHALSVCQDAKEIRVEDEFFVSDVTNKWGADFFHYPVNYYKRLAELVTPYFGKNFFEDNFSRYDALRSLAQWPFKKIKWASLEEFLAQPRVETAVHSILLAGGLVLDIYIDIKNDAPVFIYFHGSCHPRTSNFKLPVFSGTNVLGSLNATRIVPSDPVLLLDPNLEISWHAGNATCNLQEVYKAIFSKVINFTASSEVTFWGGSGGGFAALYYSFFYPGSTAMVWNPQTNFLCYVEDAVNHYLGVAFGSKLGDSDPVPPGIEYDLVNLYRKGHNNRIIVIQNDDDWHVKDHFIPFTKSLGVYSSELLGIGYNGLVSPNSYLFLGHFSNRHEPPKNVEIHCALQECHSARYDMGKFNFGRMITGKHHIADAPAWVTDALLQRPLAYFRPDWRNHKEMPALDAAAPYRIELSTGVIIDASAKGGIEWGREFERDPSDNIYEFYSLGYVGRLLSAYEDTKNADQFSAAIEILEDFFKYIEDESSYASVMENRGYGSADHSISIRANVCIKFLQIAAHGECPVSENGSLINKVVCHLWNMGDYFANLKNIEYSSRTVMICLTLIQIANQFGGLRYISEHYLIRANEIMMRLVSNSFDRDGLWNENTVEYHNFICYLLRDYVEYCAKNSLLVKENKILMGYLKRAEVALSYCVRQDGAIPPLGDSTLLRVNLKSINSSKLFAESGFLLIKDDSLYLSLICGSRSANHKQVDDSSVTLNYDGEDIIIDGGSYCYDHNNPYRKYLASFRGHSGLFPAAAEDLAPKEYLMNRKYARIEEYVESDSGRFARARYGLEIIGGGGG